MRPPDSRLPARAARSSPYRSRRALPGRSTWPSVSAPAHQCSWPRTARRLDRHATYIVAAYVAAPPDDFNRRTELPAAADPKHPAVTHRDLSANANCLDMHAWWHGQHGCPTDPNEDSVARYSSVHVHDHWHGSRSRPGWGDRPEAQRVVVAGLGSLG